MARDKVITAAHCLYGFRTHRFLPADAIHVLVGYIHGNYRIHARVNAYTTGSGYNPDKEGKTVAADWAVLTLADLLPADIRPLSISNSAPTIGAKVVLGGFAQDRAHALTADSNCTVIGSDGSHQLVFHDCATLPGDSGAPLMNSDPTRGFAIYGIHVGNQAVAGSAAGVAAVPRL